MPDVQVFVSALESQNDTSLTLLVLDALARLLRVGKSRGEAQGVRRPASGLPQAQPPGHRPTRLSIKIFGCEIFQIGPTRLFPPKELTAA